jgi:hypothetical protein
MIHWLSRLSILSVGFLSTLALDGLRADESSTMATPATSGSPNAVAPTETAPTVTPGDNTPAAPAATAPAMATPSTTEPAMGAERPATYTVVS